MLLAHHSESSFAYGRISYAMKVVSINRFTASSNQYFHSKSCNQDCSFKGEVDLNIKQDKMLIQVLYIKGTYYDTISGINMMGYMYVSYI